MDAIVRWLRKLLERLVGTLLIVLMLVTFVDVIGRYFFGQPLSGGHVLVQCLVCLFVFTGLPLVVADDDFLRVRILDQQLHKGMLRWRDRAVTIVVVIALIVLAAQMFWQGGYYADNGEYFESIRIPLSWMAWYAAVTTSIAVVFAVNRWRIASTEVES